ncbi:hypothetical protein [Flavivirga rizhaonensis]|uniref:Uncharacterized protein n=1 Tax=Flavivirga rizhaonensis TaxID=2559571 RepID=A0A4S1DR78_9FLAO|nr:hypothetical protein [Flavivirga rizhaonensis]TGV00391.1 hypothetical protein EM932_19895 [Flavivirga rizhaonensis]
MKNVIFHIFKSCLFFCFIFCLSTSVSYAQIGDETGTSDCNGCFDVEPDNEPPCISCELPPMGPSLPEDELPSGGDINPSGDDNGGGYDDGGGSDDGGGYDDGSGYDDGGGYSDDYCANNYDPCYCYGDCGGDSNPTDPEDPCPTPDCDPQTQRVAPSGCDCQDLPKKQWYTDNDGDKYHGKFEWSILRPNGTGWIQVSSKGQDCDDNNKKVHEANKSLGNFTIYQDTRQPGQTDTGTESPDYHEGDLTVDSMVA